MNILLVKNKKPPQQNGYGGFKKKRVKKLLG
jgi:hypothetical protein